MKQFFQKIVNKQSTTLLNDLYTPPEREKGENRTRFYTPLEPNIRQQADILYLPNDDGFRYALVVVDVSDRRIASEPLKSLKSDEVLEGFNSIYDSKRLGLPQVITFDGGSEFKGTVPDFFKDKGIGVKINTTYRHKQNCFVETANKHIGSMIHKYQTNNEMITGIHVRDWVKALPVVLEVLNETFADKKKKENDKELQKPEPKGVSGKIMQTELDKFYQKVAGDKSVGTVTKDFSRAKGKSADALPVGTNVRVKLEQPIDNVTKKKLHGNFRSSDVKWELKPSQVERVVLNPNQPPLYQVSNHQHAIYSKAELQPVKEGEELDTSIVPKGSETGMVEKIIDKRTQKRQIQYLVKWRWYPVSEATWENRSTLLKDGGKDMKIFIENYEKKKN